MHRISTLTIHTLSPLTHSLTTSTTHPPHLFLSLFHPFTASATHPPHSFIRALNQPLTLNSLTHSRAQPLTLPYTFTLQPLTLHARSPIHHLNRLILPTDSSVHYLNHPLIHILPHLPCPLTHTFTTSSILAPPLTVSTTHPPHSLPTRPLICVFARPFTKRTLRTQNRSRQPRNSTNHVDHSLYTYTHPFTVSVAHLTRLSPYPLITLPTHSSIILQPFILHTRPRFRLNIHTLYSSHPKPLMSQLLTSTYTHPHSSTLCTNYLHNPRLCSLTPDYLHFTTCPFR